MKVNLFAKGNGANENLTSECSIVTALWVLQDHECYLVFLGIWDSENVAIIMTKPFPIPSFLWQLCFFPVVVWGLGPKLWGRRRGDGKEESFLYSQWLIENK